MIKQTTNKIILYLAVFAGLLLGNTGCIAPELVETKLPGEIATFSYKSSGIRGRLNTIVLLILISKI